MKPKHVYQPDHKVQTENDNEITPNTLLGKRRARECDTATAEVIVLDGAAVVNMPPPGPAKTILIRRPKCSCHVLTLSGNT